MRIIAGTARGRKIFSVSKNLPVKPISDRIKQSVFDILRPRITGAFMLDLFCGTGNVSLEAISRGAQKVVMVDWELACIKNVKRKPEFHEKRHIPGCFKGRPGRKNSDGLLFIGLYRG